MDYTLHPARETRLRVIKEDLRFRFAQKRRRESNTFLLEYEKQRLSNTTPLVTVTASYTIENPTQKEISVDFGFPILRGIYVLPYGMISGGPDIQVTVYGEKAKTDIISNSKIYGIIRQGARDSIEEGIRADSKLVQFVAAVWKASGIVASRKDETSQLSFRDFSLVDPLITMGEVRWGSIQTPRISQFDRQIDARKQAGNLSVVLSRLMQEVAACFVAR
jgi:hypothetical protein